MDSKSRIIGNILCGYGICEEMLPEELEQQEYVEIDIYSGYETNGSRVLPSCLRQMTEEYLLYKGELDIKNE